MPDEFYKDKYFDQLTADIADLKTEIKELRLIVEIVNNKVTYIYAWATGAGVVAAFISNYLIK